MEKKGDTILECFIVKGKGFDFLGVIYKEKETGLMALTRQVFPGNQVLLEYYRDENQQRLSDRLLKTAGQLADRYGLHPVHWVYPGGIEERRFISGLREAKKEKEFWQRGLHN
ncbi:MAG: hypothetical protein HY787_14160 [Deltaproteobacteria bacterium]|nr:hypothetical protein [Deltaproteobacteria bacterium]